MRVSEFFDLKATQSCLDFLDIPLDTDIPVFLDPIAIKSLDSAWGVELSSLLQTFFEVILRLIKNNENEKAIMLLSSLGEGNEFHLGYSVGKSRGHGFGSKSAKLLWKALTDSKAASTGLLKDLEDASLLIEGIGTDMISDAVCNILRGPLIKYTQDICDFYDIPLTPNIESGSIWNPQEEKWEEHLVSLPMTEFGKIILVPKLIVRHDLTFKSDEYYRYFLLPQMQREHLHSKSPLVEVLKSGKERVTKKSLEEKYGRGKQSVVEQTIIRPDILDKYRENKAINVSKPLTNEELSGIEEADDSLLELLLLELKALKTGRETAEEYEKVIEKILSVILYPSLHSPKKQDRIHEGRKRIDITYVNEAKNGFFYWLSMHYCCPQIFIECKNYGKEVGNPEIDQLSGRFSPSRGQVGILICREIKNRNHLYKRCQDTAKDQRGYIIPIDDKDVEVLIKDYIATNKKQSFDLLKTLWRGLIN